MCQMRYLPEWENRGIKVYQAFVKKYQKINRELGKDQYLVPYLMSSHRDRL